MVKFGNLTNPTNDVLKEIKIIKRLGLDFVEINLEWPCGEPEILKREKCEILGLLKKFNLFAIAHTAYWIDLSSPDEFVRKSWIEESKRKIDIAYELGIKKVNFHTHSRFITPFYEKRKEIILDNFVKSLKILVRYAKARKIRIILENAAEDKEIRDFEDFKYIARKVPEVGIHLDVGHAFICGGMNNIKNYIFTFKDRIDHVHMHDNHGNFDEHLSIGNGSINFAEVVRWLKKIRYDKTITFEVFTKNRSDVRKSMLKIKKLWEKTNR